MSNKESIRTLVLKEAQSHPEGVSAGALAESLGLKRSQVSAVLTQLANGENPPVARLARGVYAPNGHSAHAETEAESAEPDTTESETPKRRAPKAKTKTRKVNRKKPTVATTQASQAVINVTDNPPVTMASFIAKHFDLDSSEVDMVMHYFARFGSKINN